MHQEPETREPETDRPNDDTPQTPSSRASEPDRREPDEPGQPKPAGRTAKAIRSLRAGLTANSSRLDRGLEQMAEALDLQFTRIDQFAKLLQVDRQQVLDTLDEMRGTMELMQAFLQRQDEGLSRLEEAVAALGKTALLLSQEESDSESEEEE